MLWSWAGFISQNKRAYRKTMTGSGLDIPGSLCLRTRVCLWLPSKNCLSYPWEKRNIIIDQTEIVAMGVIVRATAVGSHLKFISRKEHCDCNVGEMDWMEENTRR